MILTRHLLLLGLFSCFTHLWGQSGCDTYFPLRAGVAWERTYYDGEDAYPRSSRAELTASGTNPAAFLVTETMTRGPQKAVQTIKYEMTCTEAGLVIDLAGKVTNSFASPPDRTVHAQCPGLVYPNSLSVGAALPSTELVVSYMAGDTVDRRHTTRIHNRQVTGQEIKSVAAGTFECLVIEEDHDFTDGKEKHLTRIKIWLSPGNGIIATESFQAGKRSAYSELSALQR